MDDRLKSFYRQMKTIQVVEERLLALFAEGQINGTVHTCLGQEASAVGVLDAIDRSKDIVVSNHRGHGHFLAYCDDITGLVAEIMGRDGGVCGGKGGSQHLQSQNFYSNGVLGGMAPVSTGMAFAEKQKNTGAIVVLFIGDGAMAEGAVYEALNMAALWSLPIVFVIENNGIAQSTPIEFEHAGDMKTRGDSWGIPTTHIDGSDVAAVAAAAADVVSACRSQQMPQILHIGLFRAGPHSKGDDTRDDKVMMAGQSKLPIPLLTAQLPDDWVQAVDLEIFERVEKSVEISRAMGATS
ncbi:thiamine pyrophosphate-dependent dehydrogenase E1 component subunit alpha [Devosia alba]|uniref:thiamine pyrophosphate-dependent dehydrogenase E1 component subunit alpha n=1 Tax=Devosia alba TaxID=3152360 RepID=UPI0032667960